MVMGLRHSLIERQSSQVDGHRTVRLPGIHPQKPRIGTIFTTLVKIQISPDKEEVARCLDNEFVAGEEETM